MKTHLLLVTSVLLAGCSNAPSSSDIEKALEASVGPCKNVEIVDVKKTNGYEQDGLYRVEYKAALEVKEKGELRKLYAAWRDEYEQFKTRQQAYNGFEAQIAQLQKGAGELRATVGPAPEQKDFFDQPNSFNAFSDAKNAWRQRADEAAKPMLQQIEQLQQEFSQQPKPKYVIVSNESAVTSNFFYKGCPQQAMKYLSEAVPQMPYDSYGLPYPESRLTFEKAKLEGEMTMRKTENGWQKY